MTETVSLIEVEGHCMYECDGQASNTTGSYLKFDRFRLDVFLSSGLNNMSFSVGLKALLKELLASVFWKTLVKSL